MLDTEVIPPDKLSFEYGLKGLNKKFLKDKNPAKVGKIGPYEISHSISEPEEGHHHQRVHTFMVHHEGQPVGYANFAERPPQKLGHIKIGTHLKNQSAPRFLHRGKDSFVPNLASRVYEFAAGHLDLPIVSDSTQSPGGKSIWAGIARKNPVVAIDRYAWKPTEITNYDPGNPEHVQKVYGPTRESDAWVLLHKPKK